MKLRTGLTFSSLIGFLFAESDSFLVAPSTGKVSVRPTLKIRQSLSALKYRNGDTVTGSPNNTLQENVKAREKLSTGVNLPLLRALVTMQSGLLVLGTLLTAAAMFATGHGIDVNTLHWNGSDNFFSFWDFHPTAVRLLEGVGAVVPMIYLQNLFEKSDNADATHVNFSTTSKLSLLCQKSVVILFFSRCCSQTWS
jgi:hypothetical protein